MTRKCINCDMKILDPSRALTCSDKCHEEYIGKTTEQKLGINKHDI